VYDKSATIYDLLYVGSGIKNYPAEAAELHRIIREACPAAKTLLDVACGTGAHLIEMQRWYMVEGVDVSPAMLAVARTRLPGVPLREADMRTLDLGKTFDAVTCLFSSIGYMHDPGELRAAVARLAAHVAPGGVLIIDGWVRPDQWRDNFRPDHPDVAHDSEATVVRLSFSRREGSITDLEMHHLVQTEAGIEYFMETHRLRLTKTDDYVSAVTDAGLKARVIPDYMPNRDRIVGTRSYP
jgi:SAM-dependent methyltransferase